MKDFNNFLDSIDPETLSYDAVNEIKGNVSNAFDFMSPEEFAIIVRLINGCTKAYLRAYHGWLLEQLSSAEAPKD